MSVIARKKVTVQYRKLDDIAGSFGTQTLQQAISACLKQPHGSGILGDNPAQRQYNDNGYGTLVLNYIDDKSEYFFGELVRFEPGADLPLLQLSTGVKAYNLTQAKPPDGHEPLRGVLYFMAVGNHVVLIEADVSSSRAERYLSWLLSEATATVPKGTHVILLAELTASGGAMQLSQVEEVVFKPKPFVPEGADQLLPDQHLPTVETATRGVAETNALEVLKAAGMDEADIQKFAANDTQIEVTLQIRFKGQRRKRQSLTIDDTNRLLRNIPDDELTLKGPGGRQKNGKIEKLAYPANVETLGSLLKTADVARALYEGYKSFVSNGYVDG
ncbi:MAG: hypothetical protein CFE31_00535 [Rhizobiales bacterium PAR1]|nr:MAG: hypothetical protein CFE31_00535 [Rhizobiales bacterium PAR1]